MKHSSIEVSQKVFYTSIHRFQPPQLLFAQPLNSHIKRRKALCGTWLKL